MVVAIANTHAQQLTILHSIIVSCLTAFSYQHGRVLSSKRCDDRAAATDIWGNSPGTATAALSPHRRLNALSSQNKAGRPRNNALSPHNNAARKIAALFVMILTLPGKAAAWQKEAAATDIEGKSPGTVTAAPSRRRRPTDHSVAILASTFTQLTCGTPCRGLSPGCTRCRHRPPS